MIQFVIIPQEGGLPAAMRCLRRYTDLPVGELRDRLSRGRPVLDFPFYEPVPDVLRCRALLRDLDSIGASVRVWEVFESGAETEVSRPFLRNLMRSFIQTAKAIRNDMNREAKRDEE